MSQHRPDYSHRTPMPLRVGSCVLAISAALTAGAGAFGNAPAAAEPISPTPTVSPTPTPDSTPTSPTPRTMTVRAGTPTPTAMRATSDRTVTPRASATTPTPTSTAGGGPTPVATVTPAPNPTSTPTGTPTAQPSVTATDVADQAGSSIIAGNGFNPDQAVSIRIVGPGGTVSQTARADKAGVWQVTVAASRLGGPGRYQVTAVQGTVIATTSFTVAAPTLTATDTAIGGVIEVSTSGNPARATILITVEGIGRERVTTDMQGVAVARFPVGVEAVTGPHLVTSSTGLSTVVTVTPPAGRPALSAPTPCPTICTLSGTGYLPDLPVSLTVTGPNGTTTYTPRTDAEGAFSIRLQLAHRNAMWTATTNQGRYSIATITLTTTTPPTVPPTTPPTVPPTNPDNVVDPPNRTSPDRGAPPSRPDSRSVEPDQSELSTAPTPLPRPDYAAGSTLNDGPVATTGDPRVPGGGSAGPLAQIADEDPLPRKSVRSPAPSVGPTPAPSEHSTPVPTGTGQRATSAGGDQKTAGPTGGGTGFSWTALGAVLCALLGSIAVLIWGWRRRRASHDDRSSEA